MAAVRGEVRGAALTCVQLARCGPQEGKKEWTNCVHSPSELKLTEPWPEESVRPRFSVTVPG